MKLGDQNIIRGSIKVPICWKQLVGVVFPENLAGVKSEKQVTGPNDPDPAYDDCRTVEATMPDGALLRLMLCSGQSNYYGGATIDSPDGKTIYDSEPMERFNDVEEFEADTGEAYSVTLQWD